MAEKNEPAIVIKNLYKVFRLPHEQHSGIKQRAVNIFNSKRGYEEQKVLQNISFEIEKGDFFGIVGRNGSGKSTLLKLLAGIYAPDKGLIQINGSLTPFIELGVGFNPELTGRENVFLNGALLGFDRKQMEDMYDDIVEFAELEKFMDQKLKNYSSGMQVRLAFSIAIQAESDILLLDEVLAVGDEEFQKKCFSYFSELKRKGKTVVLVTHDMGAVQRFCNKAMFIKTGTIEIIGNINKVTEAYQKANETSDTAQNKKTNTREFKDAFIKTTVHNQGDQTTVFRESDRIGIKLDIDIKEEVHNPVVGITLEKPSHETIVAITTEPPDNKELPDILNKGERLSLDFNIANIFGEDSYALDVAIVSKDRTKTYFREDEAAIIKVISHKPKGWLLQPEYTLKIRRG